MATWTVRTSHEPWQTALYADELEVARVEHAFIAVEMARILNSYEQMRAALTKVSEDLRATGIVSAGTEETVNEALEKTLTMRL